MGIGAFFLKRRGVGIETVDTQDLAPSVRDGLITASTTLKLQSSILQRALASPMDKLTTLQRSRVE